MGRTITFFCIFIFFGIIYFFQYKNIPISYYDEHDWIAKSYQTPEYFGKKSGVWDDFRSYDQPPLTGYVYYFFLHKTYQTYKLKGELYKDFLFRHNFLLFEGSNTPIPWGNEPLITSGITKDRLIQMFGSGMEKTTNIIFAVRKHNVAIWLGNLTIILLLLYILFQNIVLGSIVSILYGLNFPLMKYGLMAQSETLFLTLFNLNILLFLVFRHKKSFVWTVILALFGALLFQTKINGVMIGMFVLIYFLWHKQWVKASLYTGLFLLFSILLNPTLMHWDFLWRIYHYFEVRQIVSMSQIKDYPSSHIQNMRQAFRLFFNHYFFGKVHGYYNIALPYSWMYIALFISWLIGIIKQWNKQRIIVILFAWIFIVTAAYLRIDWDRYWLHLTFFVYYFELSGIFFIGQWIYSKIKVFLSLHYSYN